MFENYNKNIDQVVFDQNDTHINVDIEDMFYLGVNEDEGELPKDTFEYSKKKKQKELIYELSPIADYDASKEYKLFIDTVIDNIYKLNRLNDLENKEDDNINMYVLKDVLYNIMMDMVKKSNRPEDNKKLIQQEAVAEEIQHPELREIIESSSYSYTYRDIYAPVLFMGVYDSIQYIESQGNEPKIESKYYDGKPTRIYGSGDFIQREKRNDQGETSEKHKEFEKYEDVVYTPELDNDKRKSRLISTYYTHIDTALIADQKYMDFNWELIVKIVDEAPEEYTPEDIKTGLDKYLKIGATGISYIEDHLQKHPDIYTAIFLYYYNEMIDQLKE